MENAWKIKPQGRGNPRTVWKKREERLAACQGIGAALMPEESDDEEIQEKERTE